MTPRDFQLVSGRAGCEIRVCATSQPPLLSQNLHRPPTQRVLGVPRDPGWKEQGLGMAVAMTLPQGPLLTTPSTGSCP